MSDVLFITDVCRALRISRRTVDRLRRFGAFPIPELPALDKRPRWSRVAVERFLSEERHGVKSTRHRTHRHLKQVERVR